MQLLMALFTLVALSLGSASALSGADSCSSNDVDCLAGLGKPKSLVCPIPNVHVVCFRTNAVQSAGALTHMQATVRSFLNMYFVSICIQGVRLAFESIGDT